MRAVLSFIISLVRYRAFVLYARPMRVYGNATDRNSNIRVLAVPAYK
jgi:hypothetical protein